jgi:hypothetical protein
VIRHGTLQNLAWSFPLASAATNIEPRAQSMGIVAFASPLPVAAVPAIEIIGVLRARTPLPPPLPPQPANDAVDASSVAPTSRTTFCSRVLIEVCHQFERHLNVWGGATIPTFEQILMQQTWPRGYCKGEDESDKRPGLRDTDSRSRSAFADNDLSAWAGAAIRGAG